MKIPNRKYLSNLLHLFFVSIFLILCSGGCQKSTKFPDLFQLTHSNLHILRQGDHVKLWGSQIPNGLFREATLEFEGEYFRPGQDSWKGTKKLRREVIATIDYLSFEIDSSWIDAFCGIGDERIHTTFRGSISVQLTEDGANSLPLKSHLREVTWEVVPSSVRPSLLKERLTHGENILLELGITPIKDIVLSGGIEVGSVDQGKVADRLGILKGDILIGWRGMSVIDLQDIAFNSSEDSVQMFFRRGSQFIIQKSFPTKEFYRYKSHKMISALALIVAFLIFFIGLKSPLGTYYIQFENEILGTLEKNSNINHLGKNSNFLQKWLTWLSIPLASIRVQLPQWVGSSLIIFLLPILGYWFEFDLAVIIFVFIFYRMSIHFFSTSRFFHLPREIWKRIISSIFALLQSIPLLVSLLSVILFQGSLRMHDLLDIQRMEKIGPFIFHKWIAFRSPGFLFLFVFSMLCFSLPDSNFISKTKLQSQNIFIMQWLGSLIEACLIAILFLGGWSIGTTLSLNSYLAILLNTIEFGLKVGSLIGVGMILQQVRRFFQKKMERKMTYLYSMGSIAIFGLFHFFENAYFSFWNLFTMRFIAFMIMISAIMVCVRWVQRTSKKLFPESN